MAGRLRSSSGTTSGLAGFAGFRASKRSRSTVSKPVTSNSKSMSRSDSSLEFDRKQALVPTRQFGQAVVGQHEGALVLRRQVLDLDFRHPGQAKVAGCLQAAVTGQ